MDEVTHFAADMNFTLCGLFWQSIIMNDRPPTCAICSQAHADKGWTFPLPTVVI